MDTVSEHEPVPTGRSGVPVESTGAAGGAWLRRTAATTVALLLHPNRCFRVCPEPIPHGAVLGYLATLRLPLWGALLVALVIQFFGTQTPGLVETRAIYGVLDRELVWVLSRWLLFMVPVGMAALYFVGGLFAHVGIALTGGAPRSIGASMRAVGYALAPTSFLLAGLDIPLYLGAAPAELYLAAFGAICLVFWWLAAIGLARTHRIAVTRGFLVAVLPVLLVAVAGIGRAALEFRDAATLPLPPPDRYYVP